MPPTLPADIKNHKKVWFNEVDIAEHDKLRGTRMVIPDPDTPFMRGTPDISDDEADPRAVFSEPVVDPASIMADAIARHDVHSEEGKLKHEEFLARRKAFYNEARVVKGLESPPHIDA